MVLLIIKSIYTNQLKEVKVMDHEVFEEGRLLGQREATDQLRSKVKELIDLYEDDIISGMYEGREKFLYRFLEELKKI